MIKFTIVDSTLQIQNGATIILVIPQLYVGLNSLSLYESIPTVSLYNLAQGNNLTLFEDKLSNCTDSAGTPFTVSSFIAFASTYFGEVNITLPAGISTSALQVSGNASLTSIDGKVLTDTQLRATPVPISPRPNATGTNGTTAYKLISLASTNANSVKASGGNLYSIIAIGLTSTVRYLKLYNKASAPTVGTDVPIMTIPVPANLQGAGISIPFSMGVNFSLGIAIAITSGVADADTGVVGAGDVVLNLTYA
jgi:hypothetical protein